MELEKITHLPGHPFGGWWFGGIAFRRNVGLWRDGKATLVTAGMGVSGGLVYFVSGDGLRLLPDTGVRRSGRKDQKSIDTLRSAAGGKFHLAAAVFWGRMVSAFVLLTDPFVGADLFDHPGVQQDRRDSGKPSDPLYSVGHFCGIFEFWNLYSQRIKKDLQRENLMV